MKLLVCDVEGTIFEPHMIKDAKHASYIWTRIVDELGDAAKLEEIETQKKWDNNGYGLKGAGAAYIAWVKATIAIHRRHGLTAEKFTRIISEAPYVKGVEAFFSRLNRLEYIPALISGGIQNLNEKACQDLNIERRNSYASCEYFVDDKGGIDWDLIFANSCNFWGKEEMVGVLLRKHGLNKDDWVFIGDGINDISIAKKAPLSIGIKPDKGLREIVDYKFNDFNELLLCDELIQKTKLVKL